MCVCDVELGLWGWILHEEQIRRRSLWLWSLSCGPLIFTASLRRVVFWCYYISVCLNRPQRALPRCHVQYLLSQRDSSLYSSSDGPHSIHCDSKKNKSRNVDTDWIRNLLFICTTVFLRLLNHKSVLVFCVGDVKKQACKAWIECLNESETPFNLASQRFSETLYSTGPRILLLVGNIKINFLLFIWNSPRVLW